MKKSLLCLFGLLLLTACGGGGGEEFTPEKLATPAPSLSIAGTKATVTWPKVEHAKGYAYELTKEGVANGSGQLQLPTYTFTLEGKARYTFRVKAVADKTGMYLDSDFSTTINAQLNQLSTPTAQVDAATVSNTSATVSWSAVTGAAAYRYQLVEGSAVVREKEVTTTSVALTELKEGTAYAFRVKAIGSGDAIDSNYSTDVGFTTYKLVSLDVPTELKATASGQQAILSWKAVEHAAAYQYEVFGGSSQTALKQAETTTSSVTMSELSLGDYRFRVKAVGKADDRWTVASDFSAECTFTIDGQTSPLDLPMHEQDGVIRAFPGAEGGGMYTTGGRGGKVIHVTNLNDSGTGSLREAINTSGARTIVFDVCGTIQLQSDLEIGRGDLTIAGQTAPGDGICIRGGTLRIKANNLIIRFIRVRMGDESSFITDGSDASWGRYYQDIILDHNSYSWSVDEVASFYANKNFTMQWCTIGEGLTKSVHGKGTHGYGGIWGGKNASFHHNLLIHNNSRNPRLCHPQIYGDSYLTSHRGNVDIRNNVVYNWGDNSSYGGESGWFNMVGNYYKPGPASRDRKYFLAADAYYEKEGKVWSQAYPKLYVEGNKHTKYSDLTADNTKGIDWTDGNSYSNYNQYQSAPLAIKKDDVIVCHTSTHAADDAYTCVLNYAGASLRRDAVDKRYVDDARNGKATYTDGGNGSKNGIIDTQSAVGGWPTLTATAEEVARAKTDSDGDHIPDYYETLLGLNPSKADATEKTLDPQGLYSNFEIYLHFLVKEITAGQTVGGTYTKLD